MNRILEVNDQNHFALVEPGVSYFDLYRYIQEKGLKPVSYTHLDVYKRQPHGTRSSGLGNGYVFVQQPCAAAFSRNGERCD